MLAFKFKDHLRENIFPTKKQTVAISIFQQLLMFKHFLFNQHQQKLLTALGLGNILVLYTSQVWLKVKHKHMHKLQKNKWLIMEFEETDDMDKNMSSI